MDLKTLETDLLEKRTALYGDTDIRFNLAEFETIKGVSISYIVVIPAKICGKRVRKQFASLSKAVLWLEGWLKSRESSSATANEVADFNYYLPQLRDTGVSIGDLLHFYKKNFVATDSRKTLSTLQSELEEMLETGGKSKRPRYMDSIRTYGARIKRDLGDNTFADEIKPQAALDWIKSMKVSGKTRQHYWRHLDRLLARALQDAAIKTHPLRGFKPDEVASLLDHEKAETEILTNKEVRQLLNFAKDQRIDLLPIIALGLFAGLRQSEASQITWHEIDFESKLVTVPRTVAKGRNIRNAKITGYGSQWLALCEKTDGPLIRGSQNAFSIIFSRFVRRAGFQRWPHNAMRHTHASNFYALHGAELTRMQLGHTDKNEAQLFANYRALVKDKEAHSFFKIKPQTPPALYDKENNEEAVI